MVGSEGHHHKAQPGNELGQPLSFTQKRMLLLKAEGFTEPEIARFRKANCYTVRKELSIAFRKLGAKNCNHAIYIYMLVRLRR